MGTHHYLTCNIFHSDAFSHFHRIKWWCWEATENSASWQIEKWMSEEVYGWKLLIFVLMIICSLSFLAFFFRHFNASFLACGNIAFWMNGVSRLMALCIHSRIEYKFLPWWLVQSAALGFGDKNVVCDWISHLKKRINLNFLQMIHKHFFSRHNDEILWFRMNSI